MHKAHYFYVDNVWIGDLGANLIGPVQLAILLNGKEYLHLLENILQDLFDDSDLNTRHNVCFFHDSCNTVQTIRSEEVVQFLGQQNPQI